MDDDVRSQLTEMANEWATLLGPQRECSRQLLAVLSSNPPGEPPDEEDLELEDAELRVLATHLADIVPRWWTYLVGITTATSSWAGPLHTDESECFNLALMLTGQWCCQTDWDLGTFRSTSECIGATMGPGPGRWPIVDVWQT